MIELVFFYTKAPIELYVDASWNGIGAVLVQPTNEGIKKIVAVTGRGLGPSEKKYSNIKREALAVLNGFLTIY